MDDTRPLASLSLTHVYYDPSDPLSLVCAWLALLPQALCVVYATLAFASREAEVALMFAGQLACEAVNFALKRLIKEARPRRIHGKGYGMPSSHAQFVAFWALYLVLFLFAGWERWEEKRVREDDALVRQEKAKKR
ncbi:putative oxidoreductase [Verticillium dahliae VDG2]|nr:putative oxidoreductase [Verticillium dahliae VDG2]